MAVKVYDAKSVAMVFAGIPIDGLADGTFLSVEFNEDAFMLHVGSGGEGTRAKSNNRSGTVTFTLAQSSSANDALSALHNLDIQGQGDGVGPLLIKDLNGTTLVSAETAWIRKHPVAEFGREVSEREWVVETNELAAFVGGNVAA